MTDDNVEPQYWGYEIVKKYLEDGFLDQWLNRPHAIHTAMNIIPAFQAKLKGFLNLSHIWVSVMSFSSLSFMSSNDCLSKLRLHFMDIYCYAHQMYTFL